MSTRTGIEAVAESVATPDQQEFRLFLDTNVLWVVAGSAADLPCR